jgi:hypothetical protein
MASLCNTTYGIDRLSLSISVTEKRDTPYTCDRGHLSRFLYTDIQPTRDRGVTGRDSALAPKWPAISRGVTGVTGRDRALGGCRARAPGTMVRVGVTGSAPPYRGAAAVTVTDLPQSCAPDGPHTHTRGQPLPCPTQAGHGWHRPQTRAHVASIFKDAGHRCVLISKVVHTQHVACYSRSKSLRELQLQLHQQLSLHHARRVPLQLSPMPGQPGRSPRRAPQARKPTGCRP